MKSLLSRSKGTKILSMTALWLSGLTTLSEVSAVSVYYVSCYRSNICQPYYRQPPCDGSESISGYLQSTNQTIRQNPMFSSYELTQNLSGQLTVYGTKGGLPEVLRSVNFSGRYENLRNPAPGYSGTTVSISAWSSTGDSFTNWQSFSPYFQTVQYMSIAGRSNYANATCSVYEM